MKWETFCPLEKKKKLSVSCLHVSYNTIVMALLKLHQQIKLTVQHAEATQKYTHTGILHVKHNLLFASYFIGS